MGVLQNKKNEDEDVARDMLKFGLDIEQISQITGLSVEGVYRIICVKLKNKPSYDKIKMS